MRIAMVEDDDSIRELVCYTLRQTEFIAEGYPEGGAFLAALEKGEAPDLLLLDVMLPGEDGISILRRLRGNPATASLPVILLTARDAEYDKIIGLDSGADDYVTKPFGMMELISRIKAVLRRTAVPAEQTAALTYQALTLDPMAHTVTAEGKSVVLTLKEYNLLALLLSHVGMVMQRELLLERVWGYDFDGETRTLDVHIRTLRAKLGECGSYIETVRGVGYKIGGAR